MLEDPTSEEHRMLEESFHSHNKGKHGVLYEHGLNH